MKSSKQEKGVSVLFAVSILSVILSIGLGASSVLISQIKTVREIGYSVAAFYAADNGIEEVLLMQTPSDIPESQLNGSTYEVSVKDSENPECDAVNFCIKSTGAYKGTRRAIEIKY
jgi:hypothetical protein